MRFIADNTVGKLRRWMGLLGYDVVYDPRSAREIVRELCAADAQPDDSSAQKIMVLGRCPSLAQDAQYLGLFMHVESGHLEDQLAQVVRAFPLDFGKTLFSRCSRCNSSLRGPLPLSEVEDRVPDQVRQWRTEFYQCVSCGRVYWEGTHTQRIRDLLKRIGVV
ncbi:MAG: hypothetical protein NTX50_08605 [Candidatus Sumerlaeota bacterium]|nr:hypothetical protein [Candidatus Sumerlaeota bacterium]